MKDKITPILFAAALIAVTATSANAISPTKTPTGNGSINPSLSGVVQTEAIAPSSVEGFQSRVPSLVGKLSAQQRSAALDRLAKIPLAEITPDLLAEVIGDKAIAKQLQAEFPETQDAKFNWKKFLRYLALVIVALTNP